MRRLRREGRLEGAAPVTEGAPAATDEGLRVSAADPLNLEGILTPEPRIPAQARLKVRVA